MISVLVAKVGFDGHDRGVRVVARTLRDAGMEVVYASLRQTPESVAAASEQEDVGVVGLSMHNGAHLTLAPVQALRARGSDAAVIVGGIVPSDDVPFLAEAGIHAVLGPGASEEELMATRGARVKNATHPTRPLDTGSSSGQLRKRTERTAVASRAEE